LTSVAVGTTFEYMKSNTFVPRSTNAQMDERLDYVEKLLLACTPPRTVARRAKEKFGVSSRTASRWIKTITDKWAAAAAEEDTRDVGDRRHEQRMRIRQYIVTMWGERNYRLVLRAEELLAKLDGNLMPRQVDVNHTSAQVDAAKEMTDEELQKILREAQAASLEGKIVH